MISDELLNEATREYEEALLGALPETVPPHTFSKTFEKKMARLCRKTKHSSTYTAFKRVACAMIVVALLGSTAILSSAEGHATVMGWINMVSQYFSSEESLVLVARTYDLSGLPDEYTLCERQEIDGGGFSVYLHKSGDSLFFDYQFDPNAGNFRMKFEDHIYIQETVDGQVYDFYLTQDPAYTSAVVWVKEQVLFVITANGDKETLLQFAKLVVPLE